MDVYNWQFWLLKIIPEIEAAGWWRNHLQIYSCIGVNHLTSEGSQSSCYEPTSLVVQGCLSVQSRWFLMYHHWISNEYEGIPAPLKEQAISTSWPLWAVMSWGTSVNMAGQTQNVTQLTNGVWSMAFNAVRRKSLKMMPYSGFTKTIWWYKYFLILPKSPESLTFAEFS